MLASGATNSTTTENAPALKTTLTGLEDGMYDVFAFFWANPGQDWRLLAGFAAGDLSLFRDNGAQQAEAVQFDPNDPAVALAGANSSALYRAYVGRTEVIDGSAIEVFIDDFVASTGAGGIAGANRTWYDGLGYALVTVLVMSGDFDGNLTVDAADLDHWIRNFGVDGDSDGDGDGDSDGADFLMWQRNFGAGPIPINAETTIPEPRYLRTRGFWHHSCGLGTPQRRSTACRVALALRRTIRSRCRRHPPAARFQSRTLPQASKDMSLPNQRLQLHRSDSSAFDQALRTAVDGSLSIEHLSMSVLIQPGAIAFIRTPKGDASVASERTSPKYPVFAAEYALTSGSPMNDAIDAVNKIDPCFRSIIAGNNALVSEKCPHQMRL